MGQGKVRGTLPDEAVQRKTCAAPQSKQAGFAKTEKSAAQRIGAGAADDHVIEQRDIDGLRRLAQLPRLWEAADYGKWTAALFARGA